MKLNQVTVQSRDIPRSFEFYRGLGLIPIVRTETYARFVCPDGGSTFSIENLKEPMVAGSTLVYFECDDLDQRVLDLNSRGYACSPPVDQTWLWRESHLSDPDGNRICLFFAGKNRIDPPWKIKS